MGRKEADFSKLGQLTFVDTFAGCGGLSLGLMKAGWHGLFAIEKDLFAFETLKHNLIDGCRYSFDWPKWLPPTSHDITTFADTFEDQLEEMAGAVDLLVGGPPCQGFSIAGRRNPEDPRNQLVKSYLELVDRLRPRAVLIENVRGFAVGFKDDACDGVVINYAQRLIESLSSDYLVFSKLLDTSDFGVPQRRRRYFFVGFRRDIARFSQFEFFDVLERLRLEFLAKKGILTVPVCARSAISDLEVVRNGSRPSSDTPGYQEIAYKGPDTSFQMLLNDGAGVDVSDARLARHTPLIVERFRKIIDESHSEGRLNTTISRGLKERFGIKKSAIRVLDPNSPSPTITSMPDDLLHYHEARTLTVRETARLQTFPDWFQFRGKYTTGGHLRRKEVPRFTQVANAVPPMVAEALGLAIKACIEHARERSEGAGGEAGHWRGRGRALGKQPGRRSAI